jgi:glycosyltransferase involved in cell wall biosynthesis
MKDAKVLYVCSGRSFRSNALGRKISSVVRVWRELGYHVEHVCGGDLPGSGYSEKFLLKSRDEFHQKWYRKVPLLRPLVHSLSEHRDIQSNAAMLGRLAEVVRRQKPTLIWERSSRLASAGLTVAKQYQLPYVLEWKDHLVSYCISLYRHRAVELERKKNREADFVVVESKRLKEDLVEQGVADEKILVAHNAVDEKVFQRDLQKGHEYRVELRVPQECVLIGYLGSYAFYHDIPTLILAADILHSKGLDNVRFLLVGSGKQYQKVKSLAKRLNLLGSYVIMKPWVGAEKVPQILSALDIAVLPGCTDIICPIKVLEYMAVELPVVVPDYACNREVTVQRESGMLFEPGNPVSLVEKLDELICSLGDRLEMGRRARAEVLDRFTWEKTWGKALDDVMKSLGQRRL